MMYQGFQRLAAPGGEIADAGLFTRFAWALEGFYKTAVEGAKLPYSLGDWYWLPSRAIPALGDVEPITEFPYFTVLYADLHAHLMALPLTLLVLGLLAGILLGRARWKSAWGGAAWFVLVGLAIGAAPDQYLGFPFTWCWVCWRWGAIWTNFDAAGDVESGDHPNERLTGLPRQRCVSCWRRRGSAAGGPIFPDLPALRTMVRFRLYPGALVGRQPHAHHGLPDALGPVPVCALLVDVLGDY
jgi:hypothetical protein